MANVLFVCLHNAGRSQMSQALFERAASGRHAAASAGTQPGERVHPEVVEAMDELGVDVRDRVPKALTTEQAEAADVVVTMGCGDECPYIPGKRYLDWDLEDPKGLPLEEVRRIRDDIAQRIDALVRGLDSGSVMKVHAWVASPEDIKQAARRDVLSYTTEGQPHEHILAAPEAGAPPAASCVVLPREDDAWLDGFTAPVGDHWRSYVNALSATALRRAGELGYRYLRIDAFPFGAATIEPLEALGFGPEPGPPHYESNRIWRAETPESSGNPGPSPR